MVASGVVSGNRLLPIYVSWSRVWLRGGGVFCRKGGGGGSGSSGGGGGGF